MNERETNEDFVKIHENFTFVAANLKMSQY